MGQDCEGETCLLEAGEEDNMTDFQNGYCTSVCLRNWDCDRGDTCLKYNSLDESGWCFKICVDDEDCRVEDEYGCIQLSLFDPVFKVCLPETLRRPWDA